MLRCVHECVSLRSPGFGMTLRAAVERTGWYHRPMLVLTARQRTVRSVSRWGLAALASFLCACMFGAGCSKDFFVCSTSSECTEAEGGRCEASGACSFPDAACPTGRRYGEAGNPQVAGTCAPLEDVGSTGVDGADGSATASPTGEEADSSTTTTADTGTSTSLDASSSGSSGIGSSSSGSLSGSDASASSTGNEPPPEDLYAACDEPTDCSNLTCAFVTTLDMDVLAGFCSAAGCLDPAVDCTDPGTGATPICTNLSLNGAPGLACALDCGESGMSGCPEGMTCYDNIVGQPALCFHPV